MIPRRKLLAGLPAALLLLGAGVEPPTPSDLPLEHRRLLSSLFVLHLTAAWTIESIASMLEQVGLPVGGPPMLTVEDRANFVQEFEKYMSHKPNDGGLDMGWWYELWFRRGVISNKPDPNEVWASKEVE